MASKVGGRPAAPEAPKSRKPRKGAPLSRTLRRGPHAPACLGGGLDRAVFWGTSARSQTRWPEGKGRRGVATRSTDPPRCFGGIPPCRFQGREFWAERREKRGPLLRPAAGQGPGEGPPVLLTESRFQLEERNEVQVPSGCRNCFPCCPPWGWCGGHRADETGLAGVGCSCPPALWHDPQPDIRWGIAQPRGPRLPCPGGGHAQSGPAAKCPGTGGLG